MVVPQRREFSSDRISEKLYLNEIEFRVGQVNWWCLRLGRMSATGVSTSDTRIVWHTEVVKM